MSNEKLEIKVTYKIKKQKKELTLTEIAKEWLLPERNSELMGYVRRIIQSTEFPETVSGKEAVREPLRVYEITSVEIEVCGAVFPYVDAYYYIQCNRENEVGAHTTYPAEGYDWELVGNEEKDIPIIMKALFKEYSGSDELASPTSLGMSSIFIYTPKGNVVKLID